MTTIEKRTISEGIENFKTKAIKIAIKEIAGGKSTDWEILSSSKTRNPLTGEYSPNMIIEKNSNTGVVREYYKNSKTKELAEVRRVINLETKKETGITITSLKNKNNFVKFNSEGALLKNAATSPLTNARSSFLKLCTPEDRKKFQSLPIRKKNLDQLDGAKKSVEGTSPTSKYKNQERMSGVFANGKELTKEENSKLLQEFKEKMGWIVGDAESADGNKTIIDKAEADLDILVSKAGNMLSTKEVSKLKPTEQRSEKEIEEKEKKQDKPHSNKVSKKTPKLTTKPDENRGMF